MEIIGERIKTIRKINDLTLEKFAERILCSERTIQRYEKRNMFT